MIWFYSTLFICLVIYILVGMFLAIKIFDWIWKRKEHPIYGRKELDEFREWDATLMDGLEDDDWDNKHHNENV